MDCDDKSSPYNKVHLHPKPGSKVILTASGARDRVLNGRPGQVLVVVDVTPGISGPVAHVQDPYADNGGRPQTWSLSGEDYTEVRP